MGLKLSGQQLPGLVGFAALVQQFDLRDDSLEVVGVQAGDLFQCSLGVVQLAFMQVQPGKLALSLRIIGAGLEVAFVLVDHLLQGSEVQALFIRRQTEQGIGSRKTHTLLVVIEQWPQQKGALGVGHQPDNALDRRFAYQG